MTVLVTGGAGYIGSHAVRALQERGHAVVVVDDLSKGHRAAVKNAPLYVGNLSDQDFIRSVFAKHDISAVMHFAAFSLVGESVEQPDRYFRGNIGNALNLLDVMKESGVNRLVFSSTAAVYGEPKETPITEDHPKQPENPYGESKLFIEKILRRYEQAFGLRFVSLRYFNAAGAHPTGDIGEDHRPETHLIPIVLQTLLGNRPVVKIFGTDYPTPDGTCIRDYIHVCDLIDAHILALDSLMTGAGSQEYNLGNGQGFSVREVITACERVTGRKVPVEEAGRRPGDPAVLVASSDKIKKNLGWQPKLADLEAIIETAWKWHSTHPHGYEEEA